METTAPSVADAAADDLDPELAEAIAAAERGRQRRTRSFDWILAPTIAGAMVLAMGFLWVATAQTARDALTERMTADLTELSDTFRELAPDGQALRFPPDAVNFRAATECQLAGSPVRSGPDCTPIEHLNLALVRSDGTAIVSLTPNLMVPPVPRGTEANQGSGGTVELSVTAGHADGITTSYVLQGPDLDGDPLHLVLQRTTPAAAPLGTFAIVGLVAVLGMLLILLPFVRRRDDLLEQQEAAVAGLVKGKADALRAANASLRAQGDFLTAISHRFRTPLQVIQGTATLMADPGRELPPEMTRELAGRLQSNARRLDGLLEDLLDVDRLNRGALEPSRREVDIVPVVREVIAQLNAGARIDVRGDGVRGNVDVGHLERIVEHLVRNAVQHSPEDAPVEVSLSREEGAFTVTVSDRGPGIAQEHRMRVFDPLYRIEDGAPDPGVGIGLALVHRLAAAHGGRGWVEAREGGGAVVHVRIPDQGRDRGVDLWQLKGDLGT